MKVVRKCPKCGKEHVFEMALPERQVKTPRDKELLTGTYNLEDPKERANIPTKYNHMVNRYFIKRTEDGSPISNNYRDIDCGCGVSFPSVVNQAWLYTADSAQ